MRYERSTFSFSFAIIILSTFAVSAFSQSSLNGINLKCKYEITRVDSRDYYTCIAVDLQNHEKEEEFTNLEGEHLEGKDNQDVTRFVIENQNVSFLPNKICDIFENLERFEVKNSMLMEIQRKNFEDLNLKVLKLEGNLIETIPEYTFNDLVNLEELYLTDNRIKELEYNVLINLANLRVFSAPGNQITELKQFLFHYNRKLESVNFYDNKLTKIIPNTFYGLKNMKHLNFSKNPCLSGIEETLTDISYDDKTYHQIFEQFCPYMIERTSPPTYLDRSRHDDSDEGKEEKTLNGISSTTGKNIDYDEDVVSSTSTKNLEEMVGNEVGTTESSIGSLTTGKAIESSGTVTELDIETESPTTTSNLAEGSGNGSNSTKDDEITSASTENSTTSIDILTTTSTFLELFLNSSDSTTIIPKDQSKQNEEIEKIRKYFDEELKIMKERITKYENLLDNKKAADEPNNTLDHQNVTSSGLDQPTNLENSTILIDSSLRNQTESEDNQLSGTDEGVTNSTKNDTNDQLEATTTKVDINTTQIESSTRFEDQDGSTNSTGLGTTNDFLIIFENESTTSSLNVSNIQVDYDSQNATNVPQVDPKSSQEDLTIPKNKSTTSQPELEIEDPTIKPTDNTITQAPEDSINKPICKSEEEYQKLLDEKDETIEDLRNQIENLKTKQQQLDDINQYNSLMTSTEPSNQVESSTSSINQLDNQVDALMAKITSMSLSIKECRVLNESLGKCETENERNRQELDKMEQSVQHLTFCKLELEMVRNNVGLANLEVKMIQKDFDGCKNEKSEYEKQVQKLISDVTSLEQSNSKLLVEKERLYVELIDITKDLTFLNATYQQQLNKSQDLANQVAETSRKASHFEHISRNTGESLKLRTQELANCEYSMLHLLTFQINCQLETVEGKSTCLAKDVIAIHRDMSVSVTSTTLNIKNLQIIESTFKFFTNDIFVQFQGLTSIEIINSKFSDLSGPRIQSELLVNLIIKGNSINEIPDSAFSGLPRLEVLVLANNGISAVHPYAFSGLYELRKLNLKENNIKSVDSYVFSGLESLTHLSMSQNQLTSLPENLLADQFLLEFVMFDKNPLRYIENGILDYARDLKKADFAGTCVGDNTYLGFEEVKLRISLYCQKKY